MMRSFSLGAMVLLFDFLLASLPAGAQSAFDVLTGAAPPPATAKTMMDGEWHGRYICAQGATGARLLIRNGGALGLFHFYPLPENPGVPEGCFTFSGTQEGETYRATARKWVIRPTNYTGVGMEGTIDAASNSFIGRITQTRGCSTITLVREADTRPLPQACAEALK